MGEELRLNNLRVFLVPDNVAKECALSYESSMVAQQSTIGEHNGEVPPIRLERQRNSIRRSVSVVYPFGLPVSRIQQENVREDPEIEMEKVMQHLNIEHTQHVNIEQNPKKSSF